MTDRFEPLVATELEPGIRRVVAPNPGMMTGPGTNTYLVGSKAVAVIDPGPLIERHVDAIVTAAAAPIQWILVTHTHPDHSPAAGRLAELTGAEQLGIAAPQGAHQDRAFQPDRVLGDGDRLQTDEFELAALHTPGHASNHLCFLHASSRWLFTGDHIIDGSTVVINPPDGSMGDYLASLRRLRREDIDTLAPGHGAPIDDPAAAIDALIAHRLRREAKVVKHLAGMPGATLSQLVVAVYDEIDPAIHSLAERSLLAHLLKLEDDGRAAVDGEGWRLLSD